jgi:AraC-like DNA-binding protein
MIIPQNLGPRLLSVGYFASGPGGAVRPKRVSDNILLFELITEGAVYGFESEPRLHAAGSVFVHRPGCLTVSKTEGDSRYRCLTAYFACSDEALKSVEWPRCFVWDNLRSVLQFSDEMLSSYHYQVMDRQVLGDYIWNQFRFRFEASKPDARNDHIPARLKAAMSYLDAHFSAALSVDDVAVHVGLSASHLHACFREFMGETPHQYLIRIRMRAAAHLLVSSDSPIKAIAHEVGYVNTESFCRAFKKYYDRTAASHRSLYRNYDAATTDPGGRVSGFHAAHAAVVCHAVE